MDAITERHETYRAFVVACIAEARELLGDDATDAAIIEQAAEIIACMTCDAEDSVAIWMGE